MTEMKQLPEKISDCLELAINDLEAVEKLKDTYTIDMSNWHFPVKEKCIVCLAGSVMANTLNTPPTLKLVPSDLDDYNRSRLHAIDDLRTGDIGTAIGRVEGHVDFPLNQIEINIVDYHSSSEAFKEQMRDVAKFLRKLGH